MADIALREFLEILYPPVTRGELLAYVKRPFQRRFGTANNIERFEQKIRKLDAAGFDVYLTVNTLDGPSVRARGSMTRGTEEEVIPQTDKFEPSAVWVTQTPTGVPHTTTWSPRSFVSALAEGDRSSRPTTTAFP